MSRSALWLTIAIAACSKSSPSSPSVPAAAPVPVPGAKVITSETQVCDLLTDEEVSAELKVPVTARELPKSGEHSAPSCGWQTSDDPNSMGVRVLLFYHPDDPEGPQYYKEKVGDLCGTRGQKIEDVGDEAMGCAGIWVRKKNSFFNVSPLHGDKSIDWKTVIPRLARLVAARMP
jgi:hypothetical protein